MIKFNADGFFYLAGVLEQITHVPHRPETADRSLQDDKATLIEAMDELIEEGKTFELKFSIKCMERIKDELSNREHLEYSEFSHMIGDLQRRIEDEMSLSLYLLVPERRVEYYDTQQLFGSDVSNNFPSVAVDIEEAGKCFALGRNTACVFHLMRVMEVGLNSVAKKLGITLGSNPNWGNILKKIDAELKKTPPSAEVQSDPDFYSQAYAYLDAVRRAWRNPTMHVEATYEEERAQDIFRNVRTFMRHIATKLTE